MSMIPLVDNVEGIVGFVWAYVLARIPNETNHLFSTVVSGATEELVLDSPEVSLESDELDSSTVEDEVVALDVLDSCESELNDKLVTVHESNVRLRAATIKYFFIKIS
jgi:hypothetical protein